MTGFNSKREAAADKLQEPVREALKLALEALESSRVFVTTREKIKHPEGTKWYDERITAIQAALAQPAQEPDWKEQYEYQKRRAEMWIAKYEKDIGPLEKAQPAQDVDYWIREATAARQAEMALRRELEAQPAQESYDQTALELCNVCGWKTLIPDDCCLNCERAQPAQEPVPLYVSKPALESWRGFASDYERGFIDGMQKQAQSSVDKAVNQMAQPAQEPVAWVWKDMRGQDIVSLFEPRFNSVPLYTTPPQPAQERNFCSRCGKRTNDIHTCTPPQEAA